MFNLGVAALIAGQHDNQKERTPPKRPIPVTFPDVAWPEPSVKHPPSAWTGTASSPIAEHILRLKKPSDVNLETLRLFNVSLEPQCAIDQLLPQSYLPPTSWFEPPGQGPTEKPVNAGVPFGGILSNGRRIPDRNEFYLRAREVIFDNSDAFAALTRKALPEQVPPRLAHYRKFWEGLDNLAYYWDNSLDEYLPPKEDAIAPSDEKDTAICEMPGELQESGSLDQTTNENFDADEPRKKPKTETQSGVTPSPVAPPGSEGNAPLSRPGSIASSKGMAARIEPPKVPWVMNMRATQDSPVDLSKGSYRGYRIGNGPEMPDQYRLECVRAFLEPVAWAFAVTFNPHRRPPVLCLGNVRFPVRMNSVGWRGPPDRVKARQGWMEGPVLGVQCRPETNFGSPHKAHADSVLDVVRELGGMLLLAQERAREGRTETRAGEGKWWTTVPRWGGGPGGEIGEAEGASDSPATDLAARLEEKRCSRSRLGLKERRRPSPAEVWKILRSGNPLWDPKVTYEAIGKERGSEWDEVFMVSSLNHHISVLKLRIHRNYLRFLEEGVMPPEEDSSEPWWSPALQRTRWYDLFDVEDRKEAMRGLWGIMQYLMRTPETKEAGDVGMKN
ncbi:hypothetical protein M011DRAFT_259882 [Sporormia fimetaria CBS 119925]|uniref:Uncharacterized protein n=1 Tax=Sporormia fimetaria CBS 119925 TaxID=1340428 RepID=A0A6A6UWQ8_9PLEO|nr:hypothetical protein M011DRAFT_259882 [Sporormia fimetaria CBS 119925]